MYLVFDIGVTKMRLGVSEDGNTLLETKIVPTPKSFDQGLITFQKKAEELLKGKKVEMLAGGLKGPLDKTKSFSVNPPDLADWANKPIKERLQQALNVPVLLENDTALAGLSEAIRGLGTGKNIVAYVTVSTGVGGVRIVKDKIDENSLGFEVGHQVIDYKSDLICGCGGKGHLEALIGGGSIEKRYQKKAEEITDPSFWDEIALFLAYGLNNTIVHWSPDIVILGGSVVKSIPLEKVKTYLKNILTIFPHSPEIVVAKLADEGGLYGALALISQTQSS